MGRRDDFAESTSVQQTLDGNARGLTDHKLLLLVMSQRGVQEFELAEGADYTVGRGANNVVRIDDASVSRSHALLHADADGVRLRDVGSTNGTRVNGERVGSTAVAARVGDAILFGDVVAQLRVARASRVFTAAFVSPAKFDERLPEEAERSLRYDRSFAVLTIEASERDTEHLDRVKSAVVVNLRSLDAATERGPGRIDALLVECAKNDAIAVAHRIAAGMRSRDVPGRIGVAVYPGDVPSADSVVLAAQLAMHGAEDGEVGVASGGARVLRVGAHEIVVADPAMLRLFGMIERVAASPFPILIHGETGTGKEIISEAVHAMGPRAGGRLVKLNCAAMPEQLLESELFGHERGAFSGADRAKPGLFEEADGGTLMLDEIGEMALPLQAKLLRVLEDGKVRRVGATRETAVNVRVVAATHRDLQALAEDGRFREDLYYRLSTVVLQVPPLRERPREIPLLAERFASEAAASVGREPPVLTPAAVDALCAYGWPGNIRELRNVVRSVAVMSDRPEIDVRDLPPAVVGDAAPPPPSADDAWMPQHTARIQLPLEDELRALERTRIVQALEECDGNQTRAAELLGMPRRTLVYKLKALDIAPPKRRKP